ncbi:MAG: phosphonate metabolism protein/1,5-bisphosphokinase (PRPP-forming) PhnN [Candidatus Nanoarchaeia archaeon]|jgi:phosphonate metabolism protein PhnN/1,5-bisphosphokinase (PRPP-forming)
MNHLILIVGPSGSGKDTIIDYACNKIPLNKIKRFITRPKNDFEDFESVTDDEFESMEFFISWEAHGKKYGIPLLDPDKNYIINVSRNIINKIKERYLNTIVIELTARLEILRKRLTQRGRDPPSEVEARLKRDIIIDSNLIIETSNPDISIAGDVLVNFLKEKLF